MTWSLIQNPVFILAAPSGMAFLFLVPYALWGKEKWHWPHRLLHKDLHEQWCGHRRCKHMREEGAR